jgi:hypothetical protein
VNGSGRGLFQAVIPKFAMRALVNLGKPQDSQLPNRESIVRYANMIQESVKFCNSKASRYRVVHVMTL